MKEERREPVLRFIQGEVADDLGKGSVTGVPGRSEAEIPGCRRSSEKGAAGSALGWSL